MSQDKQGMKLMTVLWRDCTHYGDNSLTVEEIEREPLIEMQTVGYRVFEDKKKIALAMEYIQSQQRYRHVTWIPKENIIRKQRI